mmetsp:Transcript_5862/g.17594  ORF Transcript_5862/g.17594 Transcript_5862/m.17594 type:complete len:204 (+) Transcript_5862:198-809(+)
MTGGVGFVCGAGAGLAARRQERVAVCRRIGSVQMATGETDKGRKASGWQLGLAAFAGVVAGCFARPPLPSQAGIFGSSKMKLNESEKVSSGIATIGAGLGFVYLAYRRNRQEDNMESQKIRDEAERLEKWKQEFEQDENEDGSVSNEDLMASLRDRLKKKETAPGSTEDVERLNRLFQVSDQNKTDDNDESPPTQTPGDKPSA